MVVRKGFKAFLAPIALYGIAFALAFFFVTQAKQGMRGLAAKRELNEQEQTILAELDKLKQERAEWERKIEMFQRDALDKDLLDERVRRVLNRAHRHDVVIIAR
jgi:cell division protein FtsB